MKRVLVESPYAGNVVRNTAYLKAALKDCLARGESPYASHMFFTQFLDDTVPEERALGIEAGLAWGAAAEVTAVYEDLGISSGMKYGITRAEFHDRPIEYRSIPKWCPHCHGVGIVLVEKYIMHDFESDLVWTSERCPFECSPVTKTQEATT
jgi:hypothetical protein